jgi:hypothetical protein
MVFVLTYVGRRSKVFENVRNIPSSAAARNTPLAPLARSIPGWLTLNMQCRASERQAR